MIQQKIFFLKAYVRYFFRAKFPNAIHSPFVFTLFTEVILSKNKYYGYEQAESMRSQLLLSKESIDTIDLGAGSNLLRTKRKKISDITKYYSKTPKFGQLLFRLVNHFQPKHILELGTSLGISASYMGLPNSTSKLITLEGDPATADVARKNLKKLNLYNAEVITGNFDTTLPSTLKEKGIQDFVFFDGNHRRAATLNYFEMCLAYANEKTVFVFDDIHWSLDMEQAWAEIKSHPSVTVSIDLFFVGLIFFRREQVKQDFILRF